MSRGATATWSWEAWTLDFDDFRTSNTPPASILGLSTGAPTVVATAAVKLGLWSPDSNGVAAAAPYDVLVSLAADGGTFYSDPGAWFHPQLDRHGERRSRGCVDLVGPGCRGNVDGHRDPGGLLCLRRRFSSPLLPRMADRRCRTAGMVELVGARVTPEPPGDAGKAGDAGASGPTADAGGSLQVPSEWLSAGCDCSSATRSTLAWATLCSLVAVRYRPGSSRPSGS